MLVVIHCSGPRRLAASRRQPWVLCDILIAALLFVVVIAVLPVTIELQSSDLVVTASVVEVEAILVFILVSALGSVWLRDKSYPGVNQPYDCSNFLST